MTMEMSEVFVQGNSVTNMLVLLLIITPESQIRLEEEHREERAR